MCDENNVLKLNEAKKKLDKAEHRVRERESELNDLKNKLCSIAITAYIVLWWM